MSIESVMPSNHLILCHPLFLLPSIFPSNSVFSNGSTLCIRWPKYWRFSINPSNEFSGLISFAIDWFDLLSVQGTLQLMPMVVSYHSFILIFFSSHYAVKLHHDAVKLHHDAVHPSSLLPPTAACHSAVQPRPAFPSTLPEGDIQWPPANKAAVHVLFWALSGPVCAFYGLCGLLLRP